MKRVALLAILASLANASPTCVDTYNSVRSTYTCSGFTSHQDFNKYVRRDLPAHQYPKILFILKDSNLDYLPANAFTDTRPSKLVFSNVTLTPVLNVGEDNHHPFHGVENWLEEIVYRDDSSVPFTWELLAPLSKLHKLTFENMHGLRLNRDFNKLPKNLASVHIKNSTIGRTDPHWMSQLNNLEEVSLINTDLQGFNRSMLPKPAPKLSSLVLENNALTALPPDLTEEVPHLTTVNLRSNEVATFDEHTFAGLDKSRAQVDLEGNPLNCDCHSRFLKEVPPHWRYPPCVTPERLKGRKVKDIGLSQLFCN